MRNIYKTLIIANVLVLPYSGLAQCGSGIAGGSSSNMFTQIRNGTNPVAADKNLNTVVFIHRNNAATFGGNSGHLRYDISTNAGLTWTNDQGVLNPINTNLARYPNAAIYNPPLNTTPSNAYLGYMGATIDNITSAWNGVVSGVRQLSGGGNTESYNQPAPPTSLIAHSLVKGAPGIFWAADAQYNGTYITGFNIYKGTWNGTNDISWATNYSFVPPFNTSYGGVAFVGDYNIAFDPTGTIGWFSFLGHVTPGPTNYAYYPVFYKTTDGGLTWSGPIQIDLNQFSCLATNITAGNVVSTNFEHDLVVDVYGNPHLLTTVGNGTNAYSILYGNWHHMFDITAVNGVWTAYDLGNVNAGRGTWGVVPNSATQDMAPQAARTADGNKLFFTWSDNASYIIGAANQTPDFFGKGFDVTTQKWTMTKDFTSCNIPVAGSIFFPHLAEEVLEPSANNYKLAPVYGAFTPGNDPLQVSNFKFLDNITFASTDFSISQPAAAISIAQGTNVIVCATGSVNLSLNGFPEGILWSNGVGSVVNQVSTPGIYTVTAMAGCNIGMDTIMVTALTTTISNQNMVCLGETSTLTASGNAYNYVWSPGTIAANSITVSPMSTTVYSVDAAGDQGCVNTLTTTVTVVPPPTLTVTGASTVCIGATLTQTVSGADTYSWNGVTPGNSFALTPTVNTTYTVLGVDINGCSSQKTVNISVVPGPPISVIPSKTVICVGETVTLTTIGAKNFSITGSSFSNTLTSTPTGTNIPSYTSVTPTVTTTYTTTGINNAGCTSRSALTVSVSACTGLEALAEQGEINLYPNPNNGEFYISTSTDIDLILVNELGQTVKTISLNHGNDRQVKVKDLASGIYIVAGRNGNVMITQKIIVTK